MNIHEYQAKEILFRLRDQDSERPGGLRPSGRRSRSSGNRRGPFVVKAQVHAGGRGKAGGIRKAKDPTEVREVARAMFEMRLVTPRPARRGSRSAGFWWKRRSRSAKELYLGVTIDRKLGKVVVIGCSEGGVEIEEVSARSPEKIQKFAMESGCGFTYFQGRKLAIDMGLQGATIGKGAAVAYALFRAFMDCDCSLAEINPLVLTTRGELVALDAKMNIDDSALYRHPELQALRDIEQEDPRDVEATRLNLNYVNLSGNIGCIVNGAGLGMATLDLLKYYGGEPANFLDAGAGATKDVIRNAFGLLALRPQGQRASSSTCSGGSPAATATPRALWTRSGSGP